MRPPAYTPPAPDQAQGGLQPRPASASLGQPRPIGRHVLAGRPHWPCSPHRPSTNSCTPMSFPVGILRPDWLSNATFLGRSTRNGRPVLGWTKADFIDYYADPSTCEPVSCMSKTSWLGLWPACAPEASSSARARLGLSQARANQPLAAWVALAGQGQSRETDRSKQKPRLDGRLCHIGRAFRHRSRGTSTR